MKTKKVLSLFLAAVMAIILCPAFIPTARAAETSPGEPEMNTRVYANGTPVVIQEDPVDNSVRMYKASNLSTALFSGADISNLVIYGGWENAEYIGDTSVTILSGTFSGNIFGGNREGSVNGTANLIIEDSTFFYSIYGGGAYASTENTNITIKNSMVGGDVYGGGREQDAAVTGNTYVKITNVTATNIVGGGQSIGCDVGSTDIQVSDSTVNSIYGGSLNGDVQNSTKVNIVDSQGFSVSGGSVQGDVLGSASVDIDNSQIGHTVNGGSGGGGDGNVAGDTRVSIKNKSTVGNVYGGGDNGNVGGSAHVTINDSTVEDRVYGGSNNGNVDGSTHVTINDSTIKDSVYGGGFQGAVVSSTNIMLKDSKVDTKGTQYAGVYGGGYRPTTTVGDANITIDGDSPVAYNIYGGGFQGEVTGDTSITITGNNEFSGNIYGGGFEGEVLGDTSVTIKGGTFDGEIYGSGYIDFFGPVNGVTHVTIEDGTFDGNVYGHYIHAQDAEASGSQVDISGGKFNGDVYGGYAMGADTATASDNILKISGGEFNGNVYGGAVFPQNYIPTVAKADNNRVNISGGTFNGGTIAGGESLKLGANTTTTTSGNEVTIEGNATFAKDASGFYPILHGGNPYNSDSISTGNTLNLKIKGLDVYELQYFQTINFTIPAGFQKSVNGVGDTKIRVADGSPADLTGVTAVSLAFAALPSPALSVGDELTLIYNISGTYTDTVTVSGYTFALSADNTGAVPRLVAKVTEVPPLTYTISATTPDSFGALQTPYTQPEAKTVTVKNTGTGSVTLTQPTATDYIIGTLSKTALAAGEEATFTVRPKADLPVGPHNETISISGTGGASAAVGVSFTVTDHPVYSLTVTAGPGGTVSGTSSGSYAAETAISVTAASDSGYQFRDWTVSGVTITTTDNPAEFRMPTNTVTLTANFTSTNTGGETGIYPPFTADPLTIPGYGDTDKTHAIPAELDTITGAVTVTLSGADIGALIAEAQDAAQEAGPVVTLDAARLWAAKSLTVDANAYTRFAEAGLTLQIKLPNGSVVFDPDALAKLADAAASGGTPVKVAVFAVEEDELTPMQAAQVKGYDTVVNIDVFVGNDKVDVPMTVRLPYTLKDGEDPKAVCAWYLDGKGVLTRLSGTYDADTGLVTFTVSHQSYYAAGYDPVALWVNMFSDLSESAWYYDAVAFVSYYGYVGGDGKGHFMPDATLTRAMFATLVWNLEGKPRSAASGGRFTDVPFGAWYADAVQWAADSGIVQGTGDGTFNPQGTLTRQAMVTLLYNYAVYKGYDIPVYQEAEDGPRTAAWAEEAARKLLEAGVLLGIDGGLTDNASRAEVAVLFRNFIRLVVGG